MARVSKRTQIEQGRKEAAKAADRLPQPPTCHIDKLPYEILAKVLQRVRNSWAKNEINDFVALLTVSHRWYALAKPILCTNVILTNTAFPPFLAYITPTDINSIRSLSLIISPLAGEKEAAKIPQPHGPLVWNWQRPTPLTNDIWKHLRKFAKWLPVMERLASFSVRVKQPDPRRCHENWLKDSVLQLLLKSLPERCTSLELDTGSFCGYEGEAHLCDGFRAILPRMQHVRLHLGELCEHMLVIPSSSRAGGCAASTPAAGQPASPPQPKTYTHAPNLETLILHMNSCIAESTLFDAADFETTKCDLQPTPRSLKNALVYAQRVGAFPNITKLSVFTLDLPIDRHEGRYNPPYDFLSTNLIHCDLISQQKTAMPYVRVERHLDADFLRYRDAQGEIRSAFGDWVALTSLAEHNAWITTASGSRMPAPNLRTPWAQDNGYEIDDSTVGLFGEEAALAQRTRHLTGPGRHSGLRYYYGYGDVGDYARYVVVRDLISGWEQEYIEEACKGTMWYYLG
jgi:hypothetical protein